MFYFVKTIFYSVIVLLVELQLSACISLTQQEYNIIANSPFKLVCNVENTITNGVTIRSPDNIAVVSCTPTIPFPPANATCSTSSANYAGSIDETTNTVTVTSSSLPGDVNGTWSCTHGTSVSTIVFPNPIPCLISENFVLSPNSVAANVTTDTTAFSLSATYSCVNVDVTFKWILKAGTSHTFTSSSVSKDSSACTDTVSCTGVNAYTQTISSESIFQFATGQNLLGGYELSAEAHYSNGIIALKSHSIGYFEFSEPVSTPIPTTKPLPDQRCFLGLQSSKAICAVITSGIVVVPVVICIVIICICRLRQKGQKKIQKDDSNPCSDLTERHSIGLNRCRASEQHVQMEKQDDSLNLIEENENGGTESQQIPQQPVLESNSGANKEKTTSRNVQLENVPDKTACIENSNMEIDATNEFDANQVET